MPTANTLYAALGVEPTADPEMIAAAYRARELALQGQADELSLLRVAYDTLCHPDRRAAYDRRLARQQAAQQAVQQPATAEPVFMSDAPAPRRRTRGLSWLLLIATAAGTVGVFWLNKPAVTARPASAAVPIAVAQPAATAAPEPAAAPAPAPAAVAESAPPPEHAPAAQEAAPSPGQAPPAANFAMPTRGTKQPGFDSRYLAWSVFMIRQRQLSGSGVLIGPDRILTNCHVLAGGATNGLVVVHTLTGQVTKVEKYARLDGEDACLLYAPGAGNDTIAWGDSAALRSGDTVYTFGHPGGSANVVWSEGRFRMRVDRGSETFLAAEVYCRPGSSGGPLLDAEGRLVGIVTAGQRFQQKSGEPPQYGACYSLPEATAKALLAKPLFPIALAPAKYIANY